MKLSIITINKNNAKGLRKTMESVLSQTYRDFEYIVVDGASSDDSVNIIKEFAQKFETKDRKLENFKWISKPDTGIYNAMNKGVKMSHGEYSLMLNSGDCLAEDDVIERVLPELRGDDVIQGGMYMQTKDVEHLDYGFGGTKMSFFDVCDGDFLHQATFVRKDVYERYGYYDESYLITGDTAFFVRVLGFYNVSFRVIEIPISIFEGGGVASSKNTQLAELRHKEFLRVEHEIIGERLTRVYREDYKKIQLYDRLHSHRLMWYCTMAIVRFCNLFQNSTKR